MRFSLIPGGRFLQLSRYYIVYETKGQKTVSFSGAILNCFVYHALIYPDCTLAFLSCLSPMNTKQLKRIVKKVIPEDYIECVMSCNAWQSRDSKVYFYIQHKQISSVIHDSEISDFIGKYLKEQNVICTMSWCRIRKFVRFRNINISNILMTSKDIPCLFYSVPLPSGMVSFKISGHYMAFL